MKEYDVEGTDEGYSEVEPDGVVPSWTLFGFVSDRRKISNKQSINGPMVRIRAFQARGPRSIRG